MTLLKLQRGFNLVEVLIALIIMSVGMLGIAGLYVQSLQAGRTSMFRHNAITLAGDVADRIRANPMGGAAYTNTGLDGGCIAGIKNCTAGEMARHDVLLWEQQAAATLPNGRVVITHFDTETPPEFSIVVQWEEPGETPQYEIRIPVMEM
ncbi:MAG: type IV pilus modification protein PilV [Woeseiaceae bacterium]|nr:type IV pilus modification protein PilV [Woeseiaceae bacterium]